MPERKGGYVSKAGDAIENPASGERVVVRLGTEDSGGELLIADLYVEPRGALPAEHFHPAMEESFTVERGQVGFLLDGRRTIAEPGHRITVRPGVAHDWWNEGEDEAHVVVEVRPGERFEELIKNGFGLAQDGHTDEKGMPNALQLALFAREFEDVIVFTSPPRWAQRVAFGALAPVGRALGYRGSYPKYANLLSAEEDGAGPPLETTVTARALAIGGLLSVASLSLLGRRRRRSKLR
jgi:quercetin dioxygenase-like cupin family protein